MDQLGVFQGRGLERFGAAGNCSTRANLLKTLVGAWEFEPQTPTVSTDRNPPRITRKRFLRLKINTAREVSHTLHKLYKSQAHSGKIRQTLIESLVRPKEH